MLTHLSPIHIEKYIQSVESQNPDSQVRIGVLALQGAFIEHCHALYKVGAKPVEIRTASDLSTVHGICLPGGESTVMAKLLVQNGMLDDLANRINNGLPVFATCAGLILLSKEIIGFENQPRLGCLNIAVNRNAFGRQKESFIEEMKLYKPCHKGEKALQEQVDFPAVFIRAPQVAKVMDGVDILCKKDETVLAVQQNSIVAVAFHPELTENTLFHNWLYEEAKRYKEAMK